MSSTANNFFIRFIANGWRSPALAVAVLLASAMTSSPARADVGCPPLHAGAPLAEVDGSLIYQGDPSRGFIQVPNQQNQDSKGDWWNVFTFQPGKSAGFTAVCQYADKYKTAFVLQSGLTACRQDKHSFVCR
jgi:hypothetical protein